MLLNKPGLHGTHSHNVNWIFQILRKVLYHFDIDIKLTHLSSLDCRHEISDDKCTTSPDLRATTSVVNFLFCTCFFIHNSMQHVTVCRLRRTRHRPLLLGAMLNLVCNFRLKIIVLSHYLSRNKYHCHGCFHLWTR